MTSNETHRVFFATRDTQGDRTSDFCHAQEGELVVEPLACDRDKDLDGPCGCRRSMDGVVSRCGTTTVRVGRFDGTLGDLHRAYEEYFDKGGWTKLLGAEEVAKLVRKGVRADLNCAADFPVGTILEKRGNAMQVRRFPADDSSDGSV